VTADRETRRKFNFGLLLSITRQFNEKCWRNVSIDVWVSCSRSDYRWIDMKMFSFQLRLRPQISTFLMMHTEIHKFWRCLLKSLLICVVVAGDTLEVVSISFPLVCKLLSPTEWDFPIQDGSQWFMEVIEVRNSILIWLIDSIRWCFRSQLNSFPCCIMRCISRENF
jgi:hypothetical protein